MTDRLEPFVDELDRAWSTAKTAPAPSTIDPSITMADAYAIQDAVIARRIASGRRRAGWKMGLTSGPSESGPIVGSLLDSMIVPSRSRLSLPAMVSPMVEAELVIVIGEDIHGAVAAEDLRRGPHEVAPGIEVIDYRTVDSSGAIDWVADNSTVAFAVVGDSVPLAGLALGDIEAVLSRNGEQIARGRGSLVMGDPLAAVAWLSEHLSSRGLHLQRGDVILTGSLTGHHPVGPAVASSFDADFGDLGSARVGFEP